MILDGSEKMEDLRERLIMVYKWFGQFYNYIFLFSYLFIGFAFYNHYEGWSLETCFGFMLVTISTVGYGYTVPTDDTSRAFTMFYIFIGVYFIFSMISEILMSRLATIQKFVKKDIHESNINVEAVNKSHKRVFFAYFSVVIVTLLVGAAVLQTLEGWSFISSLYFAVETMTTVGYGDLPIHHKHTKTFLAFYIMFSVVLLAFVVNSVQQLNSEKVQLDKIKEILIKKTNMEFLKNINNGEGVTEAQFVLAILAHLGTIDNERDVDPWVAKFREFDPSNSGILEAAGLENFIARESEMAESRLSVFDARPSVIDLPSNKRSVKDILAARNSSNTEDAKSEWLNTNSLRASLTSSQQMVGSSVQADNVRASGSSSISRMSNNNNPTAVRGSLSVRPSVSTVNPLNNGQDDL